MSRQVWKDNRLKERLEDLHDALVDIVKAQHRSPTDHYGRQLGHLPNLEEIESGSLIGCIIKNQRSILNNSFTVWEEDPAKMTDRQLDALFEDGPIYYAESEEYAD